LALGFLGDDIRIGLGLPDAFVKTPAILICQQCQT